MRCVELAIMLRCVTRDGTSQRVGSVRHWQIHGGSALAPGSQIFSAFLSPSLLHIFSDRTQEQTHEVSFSYYSSYCSSLIFVCWSPLDHNRSALGGSLQWPFRPIFFESRLLFAVV
ncbi:hypothetical protein HZ326_13071 [Fusarium oxysporum f. sp. albedinis]|nr:hypothetical protein HZ326_13071 [Fusarium oxysporum f. sp. albedinis]